MQGFKGLHFTQSVSANCLSVFSPFSFLDIENQNVSIRQIWELVGTSAISQTYSLRSLLPQAASAIFCSARSVQASAAQRMMDMRGSTVTVVPTSFHFSLCCGRKNVFARKTYRLKPTCREHRDTCHACRYPEV